MTKRFAAIGAVAVGLLASAAPAHADGVKIFKDWTGLCDNVAACVAYGFQGADDELGYLTIVRKAGPAEPLRVVFVVSPGDSDGGPLGDATWTPMLDGEPVTGFATLQAREDPNGYWRGELVGAPAQALIDAVRNGNQLTLNAGDFAVARYSLSGLTATMLWFDETQGRVGTTSAVLRRGPKTAPVAPAAPAIYRGQEITQTGLPTSLPKAIAARTDVKACEGDVNAAEDLTVARLSPGTLLWAIPCSRGAYNTIYAMLLSDETGGQARHAVFPNTPGAGQDQSGELMNVAYDPKTRTLSNFDKARGIGDCGAQSEWVWTGSEFKLSRQAIMPECRGVSFEEWPTVWVSVVK
jgi:hypothetical protein